MQGYHNDDNFPGEAAYIANYIPHSQIANDHLVEPIYAICAVPTPSENNAGDH